MHPARTILRPLIRHRGPHVLIVMTLAAAIGAATVTASVLDMFWHFLPRQHDARLAFVAQTDPRPSQAQSGVRDGVAWTGVSIPDLVDFSARSQTVEQFAVFATGTATLRGLGFPMRVSLVRATPTLFTAWDAVPVAGRPFRAADAVSGAAPVVLLSNRFWRTSFEASPSAIGRSLTLDETSHTIVGVLPASLDVGVIAGTDVVVPLPLDATRSARDERRAFTLALLRPGVSREAAHADLTRIAEQLRAEYPLTNANIGVVVRPPLEMLGGNLPMLMLLLAVIALTLLAIACANVSNVMLALSAARQREFTVRAALGAGRGRQVADAMAESLTLSGAACALGVLLAWAGVTGLRMLDPGTGSAFAGIVLNWRVLAVAATIALVAPLGFALLPTLQAARHAHRGMRDLALGTRATTGHSYLRQALVAVQVGLAVMLLVQIGALARTAWTLRTMAMGFTEEGLLTFRLELPAPAYADPSAVTRFVDDALRQIGSVAGAESAGVINRMPVADREQSARMAIGGRVAARIQDDAAITLAAITDGYLRTMQIPVLRGRDIERADVASSRRVALVSAAAARRHWPEIDPLGQRIAIDRTAGSPDWLEVIGVVGDVRNSDVDQGPPAQVYVPLPVRPERALSFVIRSASTDTASLTPALRTAIAAVDDALPVYGAQTMRDVLYTDMAGTILVLTVVGAIAAVALVLATAGIYGLTAYTVTRRTREIGIRMALGATGLAVLRMIIAQGSRPVAGGVVAGMVAAFALSTFAASALPEVHFHEPTIDGAIVAILAAVALAATLVPARRATRIAPVIALRAE